MDKLDVIPNGLSTVSFIDPNMVNAYMYQTAGTGGQPAAPGQVPPTNNPAYTNYQPTQGYQVRIVKSCCIATANQIN